MLSQDLTQASQSSSIVRNLDDSSGSDDDLGVEARKIMKKRKDEQKRLDALGPLIPINNTENFNQTDITEPCTSNQSESVVQHFRRAVPLRAKRAESELLAQNWDLHFDRFTGR